MAMPNALEQPVPPSVREILTAYAAKASDADREVLLAILQAKAAEDQRITALAALNQQYVVLQRHALEATALAMHQQQQQQGQQNNGRPPSTSSSSLAQSNLAQHQQQRRRGAGMTNGAFPLSPSNTSSGRSPSPPTPHLTAIPVPPFTEPPVLKRKHEDASDADTDLATSSSAARQPPHSQRRRNGSPRVPPAHGGSHSRTSSQSSSSHIQVESSSTAAVTAESPSSTSSTSSGSSRSKHSPAYRRLDINSMLSNGPPISALRGGGGEPVDES